MILLTGCNLTFENLDSGQPIQLLDLSNTGSAHIIISTEVGDEVTSCQIKKVLVLQGREFHQVKDKFLVVGEVDQNARQDWFSEIEVIIVSYYIILFSREENLSITGLKSETLVTYHFNSKKIILCFLLQWHGQVTFHCGKIFKVDVHCNILRNIGSAANNIPKTDCFVFKSLGMLNGEKMFDEQFSAIQFH